VLPENRPETVNSISSQVNSVNYSSERILSYNEAIKLPVIKNNQISQSKENLPTYQDLLKEKTDSY
jgi:hypothetical protein